MKIHRFPFPVTLAPAALLALSLALPVNAGAETTAATTPTPVTSGTWTSAPNMSTGRYSPAIVRLPDTKGPDGKIVEGKVLVAGGYNHSPYETATAQLYNPPTLAAPAGTWTAVGSLRRARNFPVAANVDENGSLAGGEATIIFGGWNSYYGTLNTAERYDPVAKTFSYVSSTMKYPRELGTATKLPDGKVLLVGGLRAAGNVTHRSAEIYNPVTKSFTLTTGEMTGARFGHDAIMLPKVLVPGETVPREKYVLIVGGKQSAAYQTGVDLNGNDYIDNGTWPSLKTAEIYDIDKKTFTAIPFFMKHLRDRPTLALVGGKVLIVGGTSETQTRGDSAGNITYTDRYDPLETEWFDPSKMIISETGDLSFKKDDPAGNPFTPGPALKQGRMAHTLTMLPDGGFLVVGGWSEVRDESVKVQTTTRQGKRTVTSITEVKVTDRGTTATAERFIVDTVNPLGGYFISAPLASFDTLDHGAAALPGGQVLIVGGKQLPLGDLPNDPRYYPARAEVYTP